MISTISHIFIDVSIVLKALWSVKIIWQDLNIATKNKLTNIIIEERTPYTVRTFVSVFFSLSHVQATYLQVGDTDMKKSENNFQDKKEKNVILQQNENVQKVFLVALSKFSSALSKKQLSNVFYILRVRNILWSSLSLSTRNVLLGKIQLFAEEFSSREIISILSGLVSCETQIPNSELSKIVLTNSHDDENGKNGDEKGNANEVVVESEITVTATLKSVLSAISRICNDFTEIEAKNVVNNLSKIGLFHDLDDRTKNNLYSKMTENSSTTKPSTPPPFSTSASTSTFTSSSTSSSVDEYDDILLNSRIKNENKNENEDEDESENENERRKNVKHSDTKISVDEEMKKLNDLDFKKNTGKKVNFNDQNDKMQDDTRNDNFERKIYMKTNGEENFDKQSEVVQVTTTTTTTNTAHVRTGSESVRTVSESVRTGSESVRAFEWVKALVRSKGTWSDLR